MFLSRTNRVTALPTSIVLPTYLRYFSVTLIYCFPQSRNYGAPEMTSENSVSTDWSNK